MTGSVDFSSVAVPQPLVNGCALPLGAAVTTNDTAFNEIMQMITAMPVPGSPDVPLASTTPGQTRTVAGSQAPATSNLSQGQISINQLQVMLQVAMAGELTANNSGATQCDGSSNPNSDAPAQSTINCSAAPIVSDGVAAVGAPLDRQIRDGSEVAPGDAVQISDREAGQVPSDADAPADRKPADVRERSRDVTAQPRSGDEPGHVKTAHPVHLKQNDRIRDSQIPAAAVEEAQPDSDSVTQLRPGAAALLQQDSKDNVSQQAPSKNTRSARAHSAEQKLQPPEPKFPVPSQSAIDYPAMNAVAPVETSKPDGSAADTGNSQELHENHDADFMVAHADSVTVRLINNGMLQFLPNLNDNSSPTPVAKTQGDPNLLEEQLAGLQDPVVSTSSPNTRYSALTTAADKRFSATESIPDSDKTTATHTSVQDDNLVSAASIVTPHTSEVSAQPQVKPTKASENEQLAASAKIFVMNRSQDLDPVPRAANNSSQPEMPEGATVSRDAKEPQVIADSTIPVAQIKEDAHVAEMPSDERHTLPPIKTHESSSPENFASSFESASSANFLNEATQEPAASAALVSRILEALPKPLQATTIVIRPEGYGTIQIRISPQSASSDVPWRVTIRASDSTAHALLKESVNEIRQNLKSDVVSIIGTTAATHESRNGESMQQSRQERQQELEQRNSRNRQRKAVFTLSEAENE